ncbi:ABC transporter substrate-binding protein [Halobium salinum]|uniref:ABC transporter substrate-binding protein n=1 Tax=Halobium salinum TaxID=1364940 RepID=A0ABD5P7D2_9EURY|nr:ABC transporter substrate-binding protein [Halobium salinum]
MTDDSGRTRRRFLTASGAIVGAGLAGCTGSTTDSPAAANGTAATGTTSATTGDESTEGTTTDEGSADDGSYSVSMAPTGTVEFDAVPEEWVTYKTGYGDMGIALGMADGLVGLDRPEESLALLEERFYSQLPGFELDTDGITSIRSDDAIDKEVFYELGADLHLMDPNLPLVYFEWDEADVEEVSETVAPFFGNFIRRPRDDAWGEEYAFYTLYEAFEKVSKVFRRGDRYEAFAEVHDGMHTRIADALSPESERPSVGLLNGGSDPSKGKFYAMDPTAKGYEMKQYRDLGIRNAFEGVETGEYGLVDWETLLEVDPEILIFHWGVTYPTDEFRSQFVDPMRNDDIGQRLTAVQEGNLYPGGTAEQGPIINLFQTEMLARQQYPDEFGEFTGFGTPEDPLFDRKRVADIVAGDL